MTYRIPALTLRLRLAEWRFAHARTITARSESAARLCLLIGEAWGSA